MPFIDLATGARLHYEDVGTGQPVVAIHGFLGTARSHLGGVIDWLSQDWRVIAPTLRGYGQSLPKPRDFPFDFLRRDARDVLALMDALAIERAHLLGYSDGGEVALIAAGMEPARFISTVVWGAVGYYGPSMRPLIQRMYPADWVNIDDCLLCGVKDPNLLVLGWINAVKHLIDAGGDVSLSLAERITCPVLMLLGHEDVLNPVEYARRTVERMPNGRLVIFPCGHAVHEAEIEAFQTIVGSFLKEVQADQSQP